MVVSSKPWMCHRFCKGRYCTRQVYFVLQVELLGGKGWTYQKILNKKYMQLFDMYLWIHVWEVLEIKCTPKKIDKP